MDDSRQEANTGSDDDSDSEWEETDNEEEDEDSDPSEYSFYQSEDEDEEGEEQKSCDVAPPPPPPTEEAEVVGHRAALHGAGPKREDPLAELDQILEECNKAFPEAVSQHDGERSLAAGTKKSQESSSHTPVTTTTTETDAYPITSTIRAGVGYETGRYAAKPHSLIEKKMSGAAKRQRELDDLCAPLLQRLLRFVEGFDGMVGMVLLALKMSPGFNRLLFSLLLNDSLLDWGKREKVYGAALDLLDAFSSQFLVGILLHNLLEGDGTPDNGKSNCQALLEIVNVKAVIMNRTQQKMNNSSALEGALAKNTASVVRKIISTHGKVNAAIASGRESGIIADPDRELTSKDVQARRPRCPGIDNAHEPLPAADEEVATYVRAMENHRLRHVALLQAVRDGGADYRHLAEATRPGAAKKGRTLRVASEVAGLSADLPCEWSSGIYVLADEDRPDVLKACLVAPEGTPYENGCFEFDIFLPLAYPDAPPKVSLRTTGRGSVRFNPNLYSDGKVCLSLLGTWEGPGWLPKTSTLLQVLLSIQSLIFVPDPYFNEPGVTMDDSQQKQSKQYDRQVRAATLKVAILGQMKKPSPLFSDCIRDHFRLKKRRILKQLEEWEELEVGVSARKTGTAGATSSSGFSPLVAGGGITSSVKIVKDLCERIRNHLQNF